MSAGDEWMLALFFAGGFWGFVGLVVWLIESNDRAEINRTLRRLFR